MLSRYAVAALLMVSPALGPAGVAHADSSAASMTVTGVFTPTLVRPGYPPTAVAYAGTLGLFPDRASKSLITVDAGSPAYVAAYDARTMRARAGSGRLLDGVVTAVLSDPRVPGLVVALAAAPYQAATAVEHVQVVNGKVAVTQRVSVTGQLTAGQTIVGLAFDSRTGAVFGQTVTYASASNPVPGTVELAMINMAQAKVAWHQALTNCNLPMQTTFLPPPPVGLSAPIGVVRSPHVVDIGCSAQSPDGNGTKMKLPIPLGVGIVTLGGSGASTTYKSFTLDPYPGDASTAPMGLWSAGTERMAIRVLNNVHGGGFALFDGAHEDYVGTVPSRDTLQSAGIDPIHGRLYLLDSNVSVGLVTADVAVTPADQGHTFPEYAQDPINEDNDHGNIGSPGMMAVDPSTGRAYLLYSGSHKFVVVHDNFPYYSPPAPPDVDSATAGIPEVAGQTGANYSGSAQGFGSVIRQVGGESSIEYNATSIGLEAALRGTRQLSTSLLDTLTLTNSATQAKLITAAPDAGNTQSQMSEAPGGAGSWPYPYVQCFDSGAGHQTNPGHGGVATCDANAASVSGSIAGGSSSEAVPDQPVPDVVAIDNTSLKTSSSAEMGKGLTTVVHAEASGISILGGILTIGEVTTDSVARANGQTGGASSSFTRAVHNVSLNGQQLCTTQCDVNAIAEAVNSALVGHVRITFPEPDPTLRGSHGGYQALIRRDRYSQAEEASLDDQPPVRAEVPGMQIIVFQDNTQSSRTVIYLAGAEAEAHYGVFQLGTNCICPPPGGGGGGGGGSTGPSTPGSTDPGSLTTTTGGNQPPVLAQGTNVGAFFKHGWELLVAGIGNALREFGVWLILLLPVYLSARRWALANRHDRTAGSA